MMGSAGNHVTISRYVVYKEAGRSERLLLLATAKEVFAYNLRRLAEARELTMAELARRLDVSQGHVTHWIRGRSLPQADYLDKIADVLSVSYADLFAAIGTSDVPPEPVVKITIDDAIRILAQERGYTLKKKKPKEDA